MKLRWSREVQAARRRGAPLVALETSVLAQGLPYPRNLEVARRCEAAVRAAGAVPAAIAVIDGELWVGLDEAATLRLSRAEGLWKVGSRDLAVAVAQRATGGTTVSATCEIAAAAGIFVFATGGLGGVHRGVEEHLDISQDLPALARFPVAVVCAGAKSVLDLPRTLELLETLGVPVIGVGTRELPGFYSRETGLTLEHQVRDAGAAAAVVRARRALGQGGLIFALPPPSDTAMPRREIDRHLTAALALAKRRGVSGKAVTPFLLGEVARRTGGRSLETNLALLENNARFAGALAVQVARAPNAGPSTSLRYARGERVGQVPIETIPKERALQRKPIRSPRAEAAGRESRGRTSRSLVNLLPVRVAVSAPPSRKSRR